MAILKRKYFIFSNANIFLKQNIVFSDNFSMEHFTPSKTENVPHFKQI